MALSIPTLAIGEVAALINVGLLFLQLTIPVLQGVVLLSTVGLKNTAATWTVLPKIIFSSYLPQLLRTDASAGRSDGVSVQVVSIVYISLFTTIMLGVAQILSPAGLGEALHAGRLVNATFAYAQDPSVFGEATFDRGAYALSRTCGSARSRPCPGVSTTAYHDVEHVRFFETTVPDNITECFGSGTIASGGFRSGSLDIQFRQFSAETSFTNDNRPYKNITGLFQYIGPLILEPGYHVREGVIIDATDGGLGFRNHTIPLDPFMIDGASWEEDILWMEPQTTCLGTNWTFYSRMQLAPFALSPQVSVQSGGWFEYEDHAERYYKTPTNAYGTYGFDKRLRDATKI